MTVAVAAAVVAAACVARGPQGSRPEVAAGAASPVRQPPGAERDEIVVTVPAPVERVTPRVAALFLDSGIPFTSAMGGVVEAKLPREYKWVGRYQITARAYVTPLAGGATRVRLAADETRDASALGAETRPVNGRARGRALLVWRGMEQVARALTADSAATVAADSRGTAESAAPPPR